MACWLKAAIKVLARAIVSSQDSIGRICFHTHSCGCWQASGLSRLLAKDVSFFSCGLFHKATYTMAVGISRWWGRGRERDHSFCNLILEMTPSLLLKLLRPVHNSVEEIMHGAMLETSYYNFPPPKAVVWLWCCGGYKQMGFQPSPTWEQLGFKNVSFMLSDKCFH